MTPSSDYFKILAEDNNPLNELKGKKIDAYEMALRIEELAKKSSNEDIINGLCGAIAIIYDLADMKEGGEHGTYR